MFSFNFYNPTRIVFGKDKISALSELVPANQNILITYGGGSAERSGLLGKIRNILSDRQLFEFGGIEPNPKYETLMKAAEIVRTKNIGFVLAVGGGSVIDGTKFICLSAHFEGDATELLKFGFRHIGPDKCPNVVPFGAVLTLPATGSEMNNGAVISYNHGKFPVMSEMTYPVFSVLDPALTFTLPKIQVANGIVDSFIHTTEQYITYPVDARVQDRMAEGILQTLIEVGQTNLDEPENFDARANLVWSATMALNGLIGCGVPQDWTTHMIGHELTALFGIDHGQTLAIIYPAVMQVRRIQKKDKLVQYAERVWNIQTGTADEKIDAAIAKTKAFFESLGIKTLLSEYGVEKSKLAVILQQLKDHGMVALSETQDLGPTEAEKILETAY